MYDGADTEELPEFPTDSGRVRKQQQNNVITGPLSKDVCVKFKV